VRGWFSGWLIGIWTSWAAADLLRFSIFEVDADSSRFRAMSVFLENQYWERWGGLLYSLSAQQSHQVAE
jgi:hypothetical protein